MKKLLAKALLCFTALTLILTVSNIALVKAEESGPTATSTETLGSPLPIESAYVEISPEFSEPADWPADQPSVVIYIRLVLDNNTSEDYDGEITFSVPANSGQFSFLGVGEHEEGSENAESTPVESAVVDDVKNTVTFTPTKPIKEGEKYDFSLSYVYNPITFDGTTKSFSYSITAPTAIDKLSFVIYTPTGATNPVITPETTTITPFDSGEIAYQYNFSGVKEGETFTFDIAYDKTDLTTTEEAMNQGTTTDTSEDSSSGGMSNTAALMISVSIIIFGVLVFFGLRGRNSNGSNTRKSQSRNKVDSKLSKTSKPTKLSKSNVKTIKNVESEKKRLRKQLLAGEISQDEYERQIKKF